MKKSLLKILLCACAFFFLKNNTHAQVMQSANEALSVDMFADLPSAKSSNELKQKQTSSKKKNKANAQSGGKHTSSENSNAGYGYTKNYARQLFPVFEGSVVFEEKNIPNKIIAKKNTIIKFLLSDTENGIWIASVNPNILQQIINDDKKYSNFIQIKTLKKGMSQLILEYLTHKKEKYKVEKKFKINVYVE